MYAYADKNQIGKTSALVLTLSGVLKDILLVVASMIIFRDPVTPLQFFGYSIALGGLVYYKLGGEKLKDYLGHLQMAWGGFNAKHPAMAKVSIFALVLIVLLTILTGGIGMQ